jgi:nitroreductase
MSHPKIARPDHQILEVIRERWSPRAFAADRPVAQGELMRLFEAARWSASSFNEQPWRFVVADRERSPEAHAALFASLRGFNQAWAGAAPVLVLVAVKAWHEKLGKEYSHAWYDTGQAVSLLTIQATAQQLAVRQVQGFDADAARAACEVPPEFAPAVVMAIGYAGDPESLEKESHRQAERTPRERLPVASFVFDSVWGNHD